MYEGVLRVLVKKGNEPRKTDDFWTRPDYRNDLNFASPRVCTGLNRELTLL